MTESDHYNCLIILFLPPLHPPLVEALIIILIGRKKSLFLFPVLKIQDYIFPEELMTVDFNVEVE